MNVIRGWSEMKKGACGRTFDKEQKGDQPHPVQSAVRSVQWRSS